LAADLSAERTPQQEKHRSNETEDANLNPLVSDDQLGDLRDIGDDYYGEYRRNRQHEIADTVHLALKPVYLLL